MSKKINTFLMLAGLTTATIHILNRFEYKRSTENNFLRTTPGKYYDWRFGKIRYIKKGSGSPVLLLHDLTAGSSLYEYHRILGSLSKTHEVYALDFLGYGLSDKPDMTYTNYLYVQLITDFIKNVIGKKTDVICSGDAAPIAILSCHNEKDIIDKVVTINPQSLYELNKIPSKRTKLLKMLLAAPVFGTFAFNLYTSKNAIEKKFKEEYFYQAASVKQEYILNYWESAHTSDYLSKFSYSSYLGKYTNANIIHALKEVNNSIYIIAGKHKEDIVTTVDNYEYYNNAIESVYIENAKGLPQLETPNEVLAHILTFLHS